MKATALLLLLAFGALQGISITDCPCDSLCETKNSCPDEKKHASPDDCCSRSRPATGTCFHLEPQTDLVGVAVESLPVPLLLLGLVIVPEAGLPAAQRGPHLELVGLSPPERDCPLFLLHSALLI